MTTFKKQLFSVMAAGTMVMNVATPALASTDLTISGNGRDSDSNINISSGSNTTVQQNNNMNVTNNIEVKANTGDNKANDNVGGNVSIDTGNANVTTNVTNAGNVNHAEVDCCESTSTNVTISGNGRNSDNDVKVSSGGNTSITQDNYANIYNKVNVDAKTGDNDADDNVGGDVTIDTGNATVKASVSTMANVNSAVVGGNGDDTGHVSAMITGNGRDSDNDIRLGLGGDTTIWQENDADVDNILYLDADTGENSADDNVGGDVMIDTGDSSIKATVDNAVNFNAADVDCGCVFDVNAKIAGNGRDSDNDIKANLGGDLGVYQAGKNGGNDADLYNKLNIDGETGDNDADDNVGEADSDPAIDTGNSDVNASVSNSGNVNTFGSGADVDFPEVDFDFDFSFDLEDLLEALGLN